MAIEKQQDAAIQAVLDKLCCLFASTRLQEASVADHQLSPAAVAASEHATNELLVQLRPEAVALVDSFGFTDFQLCSTIGSRNNDDTYEKLVEHARTNPLNSQSFQQEVFHELLEERLAAQSLKPSPASQRSGSSKL